MIHLFTTDICSEVFINSLTSAIRTNPDEPVWLWTYEDITTMDLFHRFKITISNYYDSIVFNNIKDNLPECYYGNIDKAIQEWSTVKKGSVAPFTDFIRLNLISRFGGWWIDTDFIFIDNIKSTLSGIYNYNLDSDLFVCQDMSYHPENTTGIYTCNYFIGTFNHRSTQSSVLSNICKLIKKTSRTEDRPYHTFGPRLISNMKESMDIIKLPNIIAPSILQFDSSRYYKKITIDSIYDISIINNSLGLHLTGLDTNKIESGSILDILFNPNGHPPKRALYLEYYRMFGDLLKDRIASNDLKESKGEKIDVSLKQ